ncbi:unnamed protein product [Ceratitis capitata]|uniref:(Mediterranean fruit fly) hypothetical protein n=1 Tax=Ceratitis capitata TaxID=7213 RepID=A0A811VHH7_CERCA|nr:unnamed protein product [Ceratitis capitata]
MSICFWPNVDGRKKLASVAWYELSNCVGYVGGNEILQEPEAYFSRKHIYTVKV